ncbi:glycoside hydrolase family 99-like domain-containing protein [Methylobacterium frigidaeris]|uniref:Glycoside hydrolase family 42 N-terminal domain-containing protein n=1 Tax=Methylobacterium frigidaeris TaxID=2038277 RepID=A0AA37HHY4_9HYPH|nr:glycoside hydrolase family 99-like domain-containing protein [Methylobacterium frigidaeris]GJD66305.1 hypothetical protein MPEAHAMD_6502 [Methylobacterium frigidaeris]
MPLPAMMRGCGPFTSTIAMAFIAALTLWPQSAAFAQPQTAQLAVWNLYRNPAGLRTINRWRRAGTYRFIADDDVSEGLEGWTNEGTAFALARTEVAGTRLVGSYKVGSGTAVNTKSSLHRHYSDANFYSLGFIFDQNMPGLVELHSWIGPNAESFLSIYRNQEGPHIERSGFRYNGVLGYAFASARPIRVGAYYFGMYSPAAWERGRGQVAQRIAEMYGKRRMSEQFWWTGVRDLQEGTAPDNVAASNGGRDWSYLKPAIGWYDQSDRLVIERHVRQAVANGVSFFNFYWYWSTGDQSEGANDGLDSFLSAKNNSLMDFAISVCEHGWHLRMSEADFPLVAQLLIAKYLSRSNYLRTSDGRPIIEICDSSGIVASDFPVKNPDIELLRRFISYLRAAAAKAVPSQKLVILSRFDAPNPGREDRTIFDGATCVAPVLDKANTLANYYASVDWMTSISQVRPFMPCFNLRMDERPRIGIMKSADKAFFFSDDINVDKVKAGLGRVRSFISSNRNHELSRFLNIYAWNEWHEGGILEPNARDGAIILETIPATFGIPYLTGLCAQDDHCGTRVGR